MARMIRHDATGPYKLEPQPKPVWICMCGLSRELPFCDKSHKKCAAEEPGRVYEYADEPNQQAAPPSPDLEQRAAGSKSPPVDH